MLSVVEDSDSSANIANSDLIDILNSDSDSSDILLALRKCCKRLAIEDDTDDEDHSNQRSELWIWREETNEPKIWNCTEIPGVKVATLSQFGENEKELDIFYVMLDYTLWENIVTETNRHANQIMNDKNKKTENRRNLVSCRLW